MTCVEQARAALAHFPATGESISIEPFGPGHINDSFLVISRSGDRVSERFLLQRLNSRVFERPVEVIENMQRVCDQLRAAARRRGDNSDRSVLRLLPTRSGETFWHDSSGHWRLMPFIERTRAVESVTQPEQAYQAALAFGRFQADLIDLPGARLHETIPDFHDTPRRFDALDLAIAADSADRERSCRPEIEFAMERRDRAGVLLDLRRGGAIPERIVHNDAKISNVLLDADTGWAICVVDLDTVMPGLSLFDFGDMVRTMATYAAEDEPDLTQVRVEIELFEALARGYLESAGGFLTPVERANLVPAGWVIALEQGVRFLADYLAGDRYYKTRSDDQNLQRTRTQFAILRSIEGSAVAMRRVS